MRQLKECQVTDKHHLWLAFPGGDKSRECKNLEKQATLVLETKLLQFWKSLPFSQTEDFMKWHGLENPFHDFTKDFKLSMVEARGNLASLFFYHIIVGPWD